MNNYALNNQYLYNPQAFSSEELKKRMDSQENFGAIDAQKIKKDTAEFAQKQVKENWLFKIMRNSFGVEDPKKFLISLAGTVTSVALFAWFGNKFAFKSIDVGSSVDKFFKSDNLIAKCYQGAVNKITGLIGGATNILKNNFLTKGVYKDISETFSKRHAKAKWDGARGYGEGFKGIHSMTIVETIGKAFQNNDGTPNLEKATESLTKLVGESKAKDLVAKIFKTAEESSTNIEISRELLEAIDKNFGLGGDKAKLIDILKQLKKGSINGVDVSEFTNITMKTKYKGVFDKIVGTIFGGFVSDWWPANIIDSIGQKTAKIFGKTWKPFGKGNLGDAIGKFAAIDGKIADTLPGRIAQKVVVMPTESYSNFVNDKSGMGVLICATSIMNLFNNIQDAPKEQKVSTFTNDVVTSMTSFALSTPLAYKATYALASLKNLEGSSIITKILKPVGKFFGMGLDSIAKDGTKIINKNQFTGKLGGALRFIMIMFVFNSFISKHISNAVAKVFGKPYDPSEAAQQKAEEEQLNQIIPELGISQKELMEKLQNNPQIVEQINSNPQMLQQIQQNPKILLNLLNSNASNASNTNSQAQMKLSPLNQAIVNQRKNNQYQQINPNYAHQGFRQPNDFNAVKTQQFEQPLQQQKTTASLDTATYVPSSQFSAPASSLSPEKIQEINLAMSRADNALSEAEKYI